MTQRRYTLDEIDAMRRALRTIHPDLVHGWYETSHNPHRIFNHDGGIVGCTGGAGGLSQYREDFSALEDHLRTLMAGGITPHELVARAAMVKEQREAERCARDLRQVFGVRR